MSDIDHFRDILVYRGLLYGDLVKERIEELWEPDYDPGVDYQARLAELVAQGD